MAEEYLLEVRHLDKFFTVKGGGLGKKPEILRAVSDVGFCLKAGETLGIVGESGCGKSTLGNTIIRLLDPTSGEILFQGKDLAKMKKRELAKYRPDMQMIFQDPYSSLNPRMRVFDIIAEPLRTHHILAGKELEERVLKLMELVGLDVSYVSRYPHEFSGGQRQRIGIARALYHDPEILVFDEATSALDNDTEAAVMDAVNSFHGKKTMIIIAHRLNTIEKCDIIYKVENMELIRTSLL